MGLALLGDASAQNRPRSGGIIWQLVDDSELADTGLQPGARLAAQPTFGLGLIKRRCWPLETNSLETRAALDLERDYQRLAGRSR